MYILFSIETNEEYYTNEEEDEKYIDELTSTIERKATEWMQKNYPHIEFEAQFVPETVSYNNQSRVHESELGSTKAQEVLESLTDWVGANWCTWWPEHA